jgi:hypothetical protein
MRSASELDKTGTALNDSGSQSFAETRIGVVYFR